MSRADFSLSSSGGVSGTGSGVFNSGKHPSGQLTMNVTTDGKQVAIDTVIIGDAIYLRSPLLAAPSRRQAVGQARPPRKAAKAGEHRPGSVLSASPTPGDALAYLQGSSAIKKLGSATVGGVPTTHYRVVVDLQQAADKASGSDKDALEQAIKSAGTTTLPVDVWLDGKGYIRKVEYESQASGQSADGDDGAARLRRAGPDHRPARRPAVVDLLQGWCG